MYIDVGKRYTLKKSIRCELFDVDKLIPETYRDSPLANRIKLKQHYINVTSNLIDLRKVKIKFGQNTDYYGTITHFCSQTVPIAIA